jgi:hypothetical protein
VGLPLRGSAGLIWRVGAAMSKVDQESSQLILLFLRHVGNFSLNGFKVHVPAPVQE